MGLSAPHWEASSAGEGNEAKRCDFSSSTQYVLKTEKKKEEQYCALPNTS